MKNYIINLWNKLFGLTKKNSDKEEIIVLKNEIEKLKIKLDKKHAENHAKYYIDEDSLIGEEKELYDNLVEGFTMKGVKDNKMFRDGLFTAAKAVKATVEYEKAIKELADKQILLDGIVKLFNEYVDSRVDLVAKLSKYKQSYDPIGTLRGSFKTSTSSGSILYKEVETKISSLIDITKEAHVEKN